MVNVYSFPLVMLSLLPTVLLAAEIVVVSTGRRVESATSNSDFFGLEKQCDGGRSRHFSTFLIQVPLTKGEHGLEDG